jgi:hypothetical protein
MKSFNRLSAILALTAGSLGVASLSAQPASATCYGCTASWGIYGSGSSQHGERQSLASESTASQQFHFAYASCDLQTYYGNAFNNFSYTDIATTPRQSSVDHGGNVYFAGGHYWTNGGSYSVPVADSNRGC